MGNYEDLNISCKDDESVINEKLLSNLGVSLLDLKKELCLYVSNNSFELAKEIKVIFPYGDYSKMIENKEEISLFLKEEASKIDNWILFKVAPNEDLMNFTFACLPVNEDFEFKGHVFISLNGKIKHSFITNDD